MKILGVIPARYASTRFPGKPLVQIDGKPMIQRVYEQAVQCKYLSKVVVATDDERIVESVNSFGGKVVLTSANHTNGTERCAEVAQLFDDHEYLVNIQGDEPFIQPEQIDSLARLLNGNVQLATLVKQIHDPSLLTNPNIVKVVINKFHEALYFSRSAIPFLRDSSEGNPTEIYPFYKHIGLYGYRTDILFEITQLPKGQLEIAESLEQLRWLESGYKIKVGITQYESIGIDTPEDLQKI